MEKNESTSTMSKGRAVAKKPLTDRQRAALDAGRKPLKKGDARTKKISEMGGEANRERLQGEALVRKLLSQRVKDGDEVAEVLARYDIRKEDVSQEVVMHIKAIGKAKDGDMSAYEKVLKAAGYLKDKVENTIRTGEENGIRIIETRIGE